MFVKSQQVRHVLVTMGCTKDQWGGLVVGRVESPELHAFLQVAVRRFPDEVSLYLLNTHEEMRYIAEGLVQMCGTMNPRLDKDILKQFRDIFVLQCGCNPEGKRTPPEGDDTSFIEGSFRSIEAGSELPGSSLIPFDRLRR